MAEAPIFYRGNNPDKPRVTLDKVDELIAARHVGCHDETITFRKLRFIPATATEKKLRTNNMLQLGDTPYDFTTHSWKQFCAYMKIPQAYADRCDADERARTFKHWIDQEPDARLMLRLRDIPANGSPARNVIRAVVEPSTSRFDHNVLMDHLRRLMTDDMVIHTMHLDDNSLRLSVGERAAYDTFGGQDNIQRMAKIGGKGGDPIVFGAQFTNSEIEAVKFGVDLSVLRLVCTNGLMAWDPRAMYKKSKKWGDILGFREVCTDALREMKTKQGQAVRMFREARETVYPRGQHERVLGRVFKDFGLSGGGELDEVLMRWEANPSGAPADPDREKQFTKFGGIDSLTRVAQLLQDRDQQQQWETGAGRWLAAASSN